MGDAVQVNIPTGEVVEALARAIRNAFAPDRYDARDFSARIVTMTRDCVEREVVHVLASDESRAAIRAALLAGIEAGARSVGEDLGKRAARVRAAIDAATRAGGDRE